MDTRDFRDHLTSAMDATENISDKLDFLAHDNTEPTPADALTLLDQVLESHCALEAHLLNLRQSFVASTLIAPEQVTQ